MPYVFGLVVCGAFIVTWTLECGIGIGAEFITSVGFSAFVFLMVVPVAVLMVYLIANRAPVLSVEGTCIHLTGTTFAWRKATVSVSDIVSVESDWKPGTSVARVVLHVRPECFAEQKRTGPWIKRKDNKLYLDILNTDHLPADAVAKLRQVTGSSNESAM